MSQQGLGLFPQFDATSATAHYLAAIISEPTDDKLEGLDKATQRSKLLPRMSIRGFLSF